ncbi:MAG: TrmH family RNA methyltransferase, partial [Spirochaetaceae bacterium]|nr:TrmH family RNA methyltransferase [Spirochaetaceae bacterium]
HRMRKAALSLTVLQRELMSGALAPVAYAADLARFFTDDGSVPLAVREAARAAREAAGDRLREPGGPDAFIRRLDSLRHQLMSAGGQAQADWDLIDPATGKPDSGSRRVRKGLRVYLEDLRSPFNVGSVFRSADAFGVQEILLSPGCADPAHLRARRSAMGAIDLVPWSRSGIEVLSGDDPSFALELGGCPIEEFSFPRKGIVVLGSEELGVSAEAQARCSHGAVAIPMSGAKASLNVAVAFGILMYAWSSFFDKDFDFNI